MSKDEIKMKNLLKTYISVLLIFLFSSTNILATTSSNGPDFYRTITENEFKIIDFSFHNNENITYNFYKEESSGKTFTCLENKTSVELRVPYNVDGYYSVYVGLLDDSGPFTLGLGSEQHNVNFNDFSFSNSLNNSMLRELFITNHEFKNEPITISIPNDSSAKIAYIKLVKLTTKDIELWNKKETNSFTVMYDNDGYTDFFQGENDTTPNFMENSLYQYQRLNATINYCIGTSGLLLYNSRIAGAPFSNFDKYEHLVREGDITAKTHVTNMTNTGINPIELIADSKGDTEVYASVRVNSFLPDDYRGFLNGSIYETLLPYKQPDDPKMDFIHEEYRDYLLSIVAELSYRFDIDGITLDFTRNPQLFAAENGTTSTDRKNITTQFIKDVKSILGDSLKLNVRFPHNYMEYDLDIATWVRRGYVDSISPSDMTFESMFKIDKFLSLVEDTNVKLYVSITANLAGEDLTPETEKLLEELGIKYLGIKYLDADNYLKRAYDVFKAGADGVLLFNIAAQTGEDYSHPKKMDKLSSMEALEKWHHFDYTKTPAPKKIVPVTTSPLDDNLVAY